MHLQKLEEAVLVILVIMVVVHLVLQVHAKFATVNALRALEVHYVQLANLRMLLQ